MLGNFSFGDYFKQGAVAVRLGAVDPSGFGLDPDRIWVTVFGGDEELGLGPDEEAIELLEAVGVPEERIVHLGREDNFWQAGPVGPCGPCSELYFDRGVDVRRPDDDRPGDDTERFLEFWNLVFMQYELHEDGSMTPLPDAEHRHRASGSTASRRSSRTSRRSTRPSTSAAGRARRGALGQDGGGPAKVTRALRILADHGRGMTFLIADGVVPSNEDRGYVLRRIMRRAIQQGRVLGIEGDFLPGLCQPTIEAMGDAYPELRRERDTIRSGRTPRRRLPPHARAGRAAARARSSRARRRTADVVGRRRGRVPAARHVRLPVRADQGAAGRGGPAVDDQGFDELMERARQIARGGMREHAGDAGSTSR